MTIGRIIGFVIGTLLFGAGAKIGEICFQKAEKNIKNILNPENKEKGEIKQEPATASTLSDPALSGV
jgi:hypothetical protein